MAFEQLKRHSLLATYRRRIKRSVCLQVTFHRLCTLPDIFSCSSLVAIAGLVSVALVYKIWYACGETSTTLAETQSYVSSVGVQSKGAFYCVSCN